MNDHNTTLQRYDWYHIVYDTYPNATGPREPLIQEEKGKNRWGGVYVRKKPRHDDVAQQEK